MLLISALPGRTLVWCTSAQTMATCDSSIPSPYLDWWSRGAL